MDIDREIPIAHEMKKGGRVQMVKLQIVRSRIRKRHHTTWFISNLRIFQFVNAISDMAEPRSAMARVQTDVSPEVAHPRRMHQSASGGAFSKRPEDPVALFSIDKTAFCPQLRIEVHDIRHHRDLQWRFMAFA